MRETMQGAKIIHVNVRPDPSGVLYANSPDLRGLHVCADTFEKLQERVVKVIKAIFLYGHKQSVEVFPEADNLDDFQAKRSPDKFIVHRA